MRGMSFDGISAHCPFWVHTTAWTESPTVRPFLPPDVAKKSAAEIEKWSETYILRLLDLAAAVNVKIMPMFWGVAFGWEVATGYPWGFWKGADYDLVKSGEERFVKKTAKIRAHANKLGIYLAHEIHPGNRRDVRGRFQPAGGNVRRRQMPGRQRRSVALLGRGKLGNPFPQGGAAHLRLSCQELRHPARISRCA